MIAALLLCQVTAITGKTDSVVYEKPNILLIVADDLGVDRVASYGEARFAGNTPNIDRIAHTGLLFRNAWSNPVCSPTRATLMTGRYGRRTGVLRNISNGNSQAALSLGELTIPEAISSDYETAAVGKWHLGKYDFDHPNESGFPYFEGLRFAGPYPSYYDWEKVTNGSHTQSMEYAVTDQTSSAVLLIQQMKEPWFLYLSYSASHAPWEAPPDNLHSFGDISAAGIPIVHRAITEAMDTEMGSVLDAIPKNTVVIFVGDNGTPGDATDGKFNPEHAKGTMYEGGVNVPLLIRGPGVRKGEVQALVNTTDIFSTITELSGLVVVPEDSVSLVPYFTSDTALRDTVYAERVGGDGSHRKAARDRRYKLIRNPSKLLQEEMYDLWTDPWETINLLTAPLEPGPTSDAYDRLVEVLDG